ncbi:MAG: helix-turn-helix transcriptional regulator [Candidatus Micrarchaeaceae archaeon]
MAEKTKATAIKEPSSISDDTFNDFLRFYILLLLYEGPKHGYGIMESVKTRMKRRISPSQVYPFLRVLHSAGIITMHYSDDRRKVYELTEKGQQTSKELFKRFADIIYTALEPNIHTCTHCGCKVYGNVYLEKINNKILPFCCKYCADSYKKGMGMT